MHVVRGSSELNGEMAEGGPESETHETFSYRN